MTDYNPPPFEGHPGQEPPGWASPTSGSPPPSSPPPTQPPPPGQPPPSGDPRDTPPGVWAPQPGLPQVPPPGSEYSSYPAPPPTPGYSSFPTQPPPGASSKGGVKRVLMIVAGVIVAALVGLIALGAIVGDSTPTAFIDVGDCFAEFSQFEATVEGEAEVVDFVDSADCNEPHALETYYVADAFEGMDGTYDSQAVDSQAVDTCKSEFDTFVNYEWETSELDFWWLTPSPDGWDGGDRELICLVGDYERDLTVGTLENAGR